MVPRMHVRAARILIPLMVVSLLAVIGCSPKTGETLVAQVGSSPITLSEYENLYIKSNGTREQAVASTLEEREKFLDLMTNFRLKLADAYSLGLDRRPDIISEIRQYKGSLAASYLTDREVTSPGVQKLYDRRKEEIRASHILISLAPEASQADSAAAYAKAYDVIRRLKGGADFGALAEELSQDPSAKQNKGDLYYFTGGQMVPVFEDSAYAMKVGEISSTPVRTPYGLHILKVVDRKPAPGEVQCSHIMIRFERQDPTPEDTAAALARIKAIRDSIAMGIDFAELAKRNSGDPGSAPRGGDLGWFTRRRWIQPFDEVAVIMKPGQVSGIVRTVYGYHIIKCTDARPLKSLEESRKELTQLYQQVRFQDDYRRYIDHLKKETGYSLNEPVASMLIACLDSTSSTRDSAWANTIKPELEKATLFRLGQRAVPVDSAVKLIRNRPDMAGVSLRATPFRSTLDKIGEQLMFDVKAETIEKDYPEFSAIMKEYVDGILLYQVEQDRVWNRIAVNDSALKAYYEANSEKFQYPNRVDITTLRLANDSVASAVLTRFGSGVAAEEIASEDSARMKRPASFGVTFAPKSPALGNPAKKSLAAAAKERHADASVTVTLAASYDTLGRKGPTKKLAGQRVQAVKDHLIRKLGVPDSRISTLLRAPARGTPDSVTAKVFNRVDIDIIGRRPMVIGQAEHVVEAVDTDERSQEADSLKEGSWSSPFRYQNAVVLVRLNKREPARVKTFEEAGTEVSSSFQEYESKRLEQQWLEGLRKTHPVVQYKEALKNAFAPEL